MGKLVAALRVAPLLAAAGTACSAPVDQKPSPPVSNQYELSFPSTAVAVAVDTVEIFVFDAGAPGTDCVTLTTTRMAGAALPGPPKQVFDSGPVKLCDLQNGAAGTFDVPLGPRSILAVAQRGGQDYFLGCTMSDLEAGSPPVSIALAEAAAGTVPPPTTCQSIAQKCQGGC